MSRSARRAARVRRGAGCSASRTRICAWSTVAGTWVDRATGRRRTTPGTCRAPSIWTSIPTSRLRAARVDIPCPTPPSSRHGWPTVGIGDEHTVVAYDDVGGWVAARLWWMLDDLGHRSVAVLDGGLQAWTTAGLPLTTEVPAWPSARLIPAATWGRVIERDELRAPSGSVRLLDARAGARYRGEIEPIDAYPGHIPTAISAPTDANLAADGRFLAAGDLGDAVPRARRRWHARPGRRLVRQRRIGRRTTPWRCGSPACRTRSSTPARTATGRSRASRSRPATTRGSAAHRVRASPRWHGLSDCEVGLRTRDQPLADDHQGVSHAAIVLRPHSERPAARLTGSREPRTSVGRPGALDVELDAAEVVDRATFERESLARADREPPVRDDDDVCRRREPPRGSPRLTRGPYGSGGRRWPSLISCRPVRVASVDSSRWSGSA